MRWAWIRSSWSLTPPAPTEFRMPGGGTIVSFPVGVVELPAGRQCASERACLDAFPVIVPVLFQYRCGAMAAEETRFWVQVMEAGFGATLEAHGFRRVSPRLYRLEGDGIVWEQFTYRGFKDTRTACAKATALSFPARTRFTARLLATIRKNSACVRYATIGGDATTIGSARSNGYTTGKKGRKVRRGGRNHGRERSGGRFAPIPTIISTARNRIIPSTSMSKSAVGICSNCRSRNLPG